jgi:phosphoenolpyruvate-protein kinase (PTS system EI component)
MSGGNKEARKLLDKKNELLQKEDEAIKVAREAEEAAIKENIERFFEAEDTAKSELLARLSDLDDQQRARVKELLESENPEEEIAAGLRRFLE